jgi:hypothetical protein
MRPSQRFHPDNTIPKGNWIWVFGSNEGGRHGRGAAKVAHVTFHAAYGIGHGLTGKAYAVATKDRHLMVLSLEVIALNINRFIDFARSFPEKNFFITRVGCGLSGFSDDQIAPLFESAFSLPNCSFPNEWATHIASADIDALSAQ